jgi:hypothetical protein
MELHSLPSQFDPVLARSQGLFPFLLNLEVRER